MKKLKADLCIIGAGSAGLSVAAGAVQMGASVVLIEKDKMGGDCLNTGCVPSKALLAAAKAKQHAEKAFAFGVHAEKINADFQQAHQYVHSVIAKIAPNDSVERFEKLGVKVIQAAGKFLTPKTVQAGEYEITARRFVIATGSSAHPPQINGLDQINYLTNDTIFHLDERPKELIIIGGGPIGCEMAQAHSRLGSKVTVLQHSVILPRDEPELTAMLRERLTQEGIVLREQCDVKRVEKTINGTKVFYTHESEEKSIEGSHLLIAAGRAPNLTELDLEKANVEFNRRGIVVDKRLRSISNKKVFAAGDAAGGPQFTHAAGYHAGIVIKNALFMLPAKVNYKTLPWVTYCDPELAHVGLTETEAKQQKKNYRVLTWKFAENDRALAENQSTGLIKVIVGKKGLILGCSILGASAGELLLPWSLAIQENLQIGSMANLIAPYPTMSEISKRVAGSYYTKALFSEKTKRIVKFVQRFF
jgi:pyruvate/2-oxoglutarate dehydrogenase complex dihydrolipoamide dehydrogenase (E3) component